MVIRPISKGESLRIFPPSAPQLHLGRALLVMIATCAGLLMSLLAVNLPLDFLRESVAAVFSTVRGKIELSIRKIFP